MHTHANNPYQHPSDPVIPSNTIWYFAYGSNLTSETFRAHRGITPLAAISVRVPGWMLVFDIYGIPYSEPAFASILPIQFHDNGAAEKTLAVHGTAYLLDRESFVSVVASEGGGTAYDEVEVLAVPVSHQHSDGPINSTPDQTFSVTTLIRAYGPTRARCPSRRYQWRWVGSMIFLACWKPPWRRPRD
ncbi:hypothetical protein N7472_009110 [Penicillium cf. griseofulvum]|uniref:gamma-glutamylcyclotransferase n=1 Tax=Penicillium cf. griseofulvum TaxID=2972120 RepID=A0A9W9J9D4_9EURO|nr:hypothetical protein N7472_009110 [Penicillium cf. griseofulvum]